MNMQTKQKTISVISAAITNKLSDKSFVPRVTSIEPYEQDDGLFSIAGIVSIRTKITSVVGLDASHADVSFECLFKNCKFDKNTLEYSGSADDYELIIGELDRNLIFASTASTLSANDWRYEECSNINHKDRSDTTKAVLDQVLGSIGDSRKKSLLVSIFETLKKKSPAYPT